MEQGSFNDLPSEIVLEIFLRLPVATIMKCKTVCKSWLELLEGREFVDCHLSKSSAPYLTFFEKEKEKGAQPRPFKVKEFEEVGHEEHRWSTVLNFDLPHHNVGRGTVNGLILCAPDDMIHDIFICNPITRDCIKLHSSLRIRENTYRASGFGVSITSCQYKVVRIFQIKVDVLECQVYSLGTGSWRRFNFFCPVIKAALNKAGIFLNGNLHWLAKTGSSISCLELETETFTTFSTLPLINTPYKVRIMIVLKDSLCLCDNSDYRYVRPEDASEIVIWMMKEYGDEISWTNEFIIRKEDRIQYLGLIVPIKVLEDGGILMQWTCRIRSMWLYYSSKTRTIRELETIRYGSNMLAAVYSPSFLPLKSFGSLEDVCSF